MTLYTKLLQVSLCLYILIKCFTMYSITPEAIKIRNEQGLFIRPGGLIEELYCFVLNFRDIYSDYLIV